MTSYIGTHSPFHYTFSFTESWIEKADGTRWKRRMWGREGGGHYLGEKYFHKTWRKYSLLFHKHSFSGEKISTDNFVHSCDSVFVWNHNWLAVRLSLLGALVNSHCSIILNRSVTFVCMCVHMLTSAPIGALEAKLNKLLGNHDKLTDWPTDKWTDQWIDKQCSAPIGELEVALNALLEIMTDRWTDRQTNGPTNGPTDRITDRLGHTHVSIYHSKYACLLVYSIGIYLFVCQSVFLVVHWIAYYFFLPAYFSLSVCMYVKLYAYILRKNKYTKKRFSVGLSLYLFLYFSLNYYRLAKKDNHSRVYQSTALG